MKTACFAECNKNGGGRGNIPEGNPIFKPTRVIFLKEISTQKLSGNAKSVLDRNGDKIMSVANHGKGVVFARGDPCLYSEYVDGRKMNGLFQNHQAARQSSASLLTQAKIKKQQNQEIIKISSFRFRIFNRLIRADL